MPEDTNMLCCSKKNIDSLSVDVNYSLLERGRILFNISIHNQHTGGILLGKCSGSLESTTRTRKYSKSLFRVYSEEATNEVDLIVRAIHLFPNEKRIIKFQEAVPSYWPPSFAGKWIQYVTKLKLGLKVNENSGVLLEFVIKVLPSESFTPSSIKPIGRITPVSRCTMRRTNPFLVTSADICHKYLPKFSLPQITDVFKIQENNKEIVRVHNIASDYFPSQKIFGQLNFSNAGYHCMKFTVSLISIEVSMSESLIQFKDEKKKWAERSEITFGIENTGFEMTIPEGATPTFITDLVMLKWCIQFTFYLSEISLQFNSEEPEWEAPSKVPVTTKTWNHPIKVYSPK